MSPTIDMNSVLIASSFAMFMLAAILGVLRALEVVHSKFEDRIAMPIRLVVGLLSIVFFGYISGIFLGKLDAIDTTEGTVAFVVTIVACFLLYRKLLSLPDKTAK